MFAASCKMKKPAQLKKPSIFVVALICKLCSIVIFVWSFSSHFLFVYWCFCPHGLILYVVFLLSLQSSNVEHFHGILKNENDTFFFNKILEKPAPIRYTYIFFFKFSYKLSKILSFLYKLSYWYQTHTHTRWLWFTHSVTLFEYRHPVVVFIHIFIELFNNGFCDGIFFTISAEVWYIKQQKQRKHKRKAAILKKKVFWTNLSHTDIKKQLFNHITTGKNCREAKSDICIYVQT